MMLRLIDAWIGRRRLVDVSAVAAVAHLRPGVVVAGGSEGIGLAIARRLAAAGRDVVVVARSEERLVAAVQGLASLAPAGTVIAHAAIDITAPTAADQIEAATLRAGLYVDTLMIAAGLGLGGAFIDQDPHELDRLVATNVAALTAFVRHVLPRQLARGRGGILVLSSLGACTPGPYQAAYYASKAYALSLMEALAAENRGRGVRLAVVVPGPVETAFHARMGAESALYRWLLPALSADAVAASALRGYRMGHTVIAPGLLGWPMIVGMRILPHGLLVPLIGWLLRPR